MVENNEKEQEQDQNQQEVDETVSAIDSFLEEEETEGENEQEGLSIKELRRRNKKYKNLSILAGVILVIFAISLFLFWSYNKYYAINAKNDLSKDEKEFVNTFNKTENTIKDSLNYVYTNINPNGGSIGGDTSDNQSQNKIVNIEKHNFKKAKESFKKFINSNDIPYLDKKNQISSKLKNIKNKLQKNYNNINKLKSNIGKFAFYPKEVNNIINNNTIQRAVTSIETIKIFTALRLYGKLSGKISDFAEYASITNSKAKSIINNSVERGERDIHKYLNKCFLNPFENNNCNKIGDFKNYYKINEEDKFENISINNFKKLMKFVVRELEFSRLPRLEIILNSLNNKENKISFMVDLNLFKEDQKSLQEKGISDGHSFIVKTLINTLRGSQFIRGGNINIDKIEKNTKTLVSGEQEYKVSNSNFNFDVPVQKAVESEIYDFIYDS